MPKQQSPAQRETVERVMHEFKHGGLKTARGEKKVKNPKQAIAIALHEAGASKSESPRDNARNLRRTKAKERRGDTYRDEVEGRRHGSAHSNGRKASRASPAGDKTKAALCRGKTAQHCRPLDDEQATARTRPRPVISPIPSLRGATRRSNLVKCLV